MPYAKGDRTRSNGFRLQQREFRLEISKKFLIMRVVKLCKRLPREDVHSPSQC